MKERKIFFSILILPLLMIKRKTAENNKMMYISNERIIMASQNAKPKDSVARNTDAQSMNIYIYIYI